MIWRIFRVMLFSIMGVCVVIVAYIGAAFIGGLVPAGDSAGFSDDGEQQVEIYLLSTLLHVDIAIPVTEDVREQFAFLRRDAFPLDHPDLQYLVVGWGSQAFYPATKNLNDMRIAATFTAITADDAVLHVLPAKDVSRNSNANSVTMSDAGLSAMLDSILGDFKRLDGEVLPPLEDASHGQGDLFYEAKGHFNILHPCNVWASKQLRIGGIKTGIWTPTSQSLIMSLGD